MPVIVVLDVNIGNRWLGGSLSNSDSAGSFKPGCSELCLGMVFHFERLGEATFCSLVVMFSSTQIFYSN